MSNYKSVESSHIVYTDASLRRLEDLKIDREKAWGYISQCMKVYLLDEARRLLVGKVWEEKNRLFDNLPTENFSGFAHDDDHINLAVSLLSMMLIGYKKMTDDQDIVPKLKELTANDVTSLLVDMIAHDWGYIKEGEKGKFSIDLTDGHEERSINKLSAFIKNLQREIEESGLPVESFNEILNNVELIKATALTYSADRAKFYQDENTMKCLFLKDADLCSWLVIEPEEYLLKQWRLYQELEQSAKVNNRKFPYRNFDDFYYSLPNDGSGSFLEKTMSMSRYLIRFINKYYEYWGLQVENPVAELININIVPIISFVRRFKTQSNSDE